MGRNTLYNYYSSSLRGVPVDLWLVILLTGIAIAGATVPVLRETPIRFVAGSLFVFVIPGYAISAALYPRLFLFEDSSETGDGIDLLERLTISLGVSISLVSLNGILLSATVGLTALPLALSIGGLSLCATLVAVRRRQEVPPEVRDPLKPYVRSLSVKTILPPERSERLLVYICLIGIVLAVFSVGFATTQPSDSDKFTRFYVLGDSTDDSAANYPGPMHVDEPQNVTVGVANHEYRKMEYTIIVFSEQIREQGNTQSITDTSRIATQRVSLEHDEVIQRNISIEFQSASNRSRVQFYLFRGDPPTDPQSVTPYRRTHLWVSVTE